MLRISVVSTKDIKKRAFKTILIALIFGIFIKSYVELNGKIPKNQNDLNKSMKFISKEITLFSKEELSSKLTTSKLLDSEFRVSKLVTSRYSSSLEDINLKADNIEESHIEEQDDESQEAVDTQEITNEAELKSMDEIQTNLDIQVIDCGVKTTYNFDIEGVKVKNETGYTLEQMNLKDSLEINKQKLLIFHTHTCESYSQSDGNTYIPSGNYRTTDLSHSVVRIGDVLADYLSSSGHVVLHDKTLHDYPAYTGSYGRSLKTVSGIIRENQDVDVVIDLHRDAIGDESYAPKVKIGDEYAAQIMFVIGTNGSGLQHDNWKENLEFAIMVQKKANELYPGLFKPILLRNARYNQHLTKAANIIEIGATGNTQEECENSAKYLSKVLDEIMK